MKFEYKNCDFLIVLLSSLILKQKFERVKFDLMNIISTAIPEVKLIEPMVFSDDRGFFMEVYKQTIFANAGIHENFIQANHSGSKKGVLRGIHYQICHAQGKLVRVVKGAVFDVAVDLRKSSPTFGKYVSFVLSEENQRELWVPPGFGHAFFVMSTWAEFTYLVTDIYSPAHELTILWNDPDINIDWPFSNDSEIIVSEKDAAGILLVDADVYE